MSAVNFLVLSSGKRTQAASTGLTPDFTGIRIGADTLPLVQGGTGASAYFDFGSRSLRTSFVPAANPDLVNLLYLSTNYAPLASPALTGNPTAPTQSAADNSTKIATTAFVQTALAGFSNVVSWANAALAYQSAPPGSPSTGDRYVVQPTGTGAWAGHDNAIAQWNGSSWVFTAPTNGTFIDVIAYTTGVYFFNGTAWITKDFEATTASTGIRLVGRDVQRDDALTFVNDNASAITLGQVVYIKSNGHVDLANATGGATPGNGTIGIVDDASIAASGSGRIDIRPGYILTTSGLTPGQSYYVSKTAGAIDLFANISYATGDAVIRVGRAMSATQLVFEPFFEYQF